MARLFPARVYWSSSEGQSSTSPMLETRANDMPYPGDKAPGDGSYTTRR